MLDIVYKIIIVVPSIAPLTIPYTLPLTAAIITQSTTATIPNIEPTI